MAKRHTTMSTTTAGACALLFLSVASAPAWAVKARPGPVDPSVKTMTYETWDKHKIIGHLRRNTMLIFDPDIILTVAGADVSEDTSHAWHVTRLANRTHLLVRPILPKVPTNMHVIVQTPDGEKKTLVFDLIFGTTRKDGTPIDPTNVIDFRDANKTNVVTYPEARTVRALASAKRTGGWKSPANYNTAYTWAGDQQLVPREIFDDGLDTWVWFDPSIDVHPAIAAVNPDGTLRRVNWSPKDGYLVIHEVAAQFLFAYGKFNYSSATQTLTSATCIFNEGWKGRALDERAPKEKAAPKFKPPQPMTKTKTRPKVVTVTVPVRNAYHLPAPTWTLREFKS